MHFSSVEYGFGPFPYQVLASSGESMLNLLMYVKVDATLGYRRLFKKPNFRLWC